MEGSSIPRTLLISVELGTFLGCAYVLGVIVYRLTFHPLAKSAVGDRHIHFLELHKKYGEFSITDQSKNNLPDQISFPGPIVRFGPNRISVNTAEGLQKIYGAKANTQKATYYHVFNDVFKGDSSLTTIDHSLHAKKKRVVSTALAEKSVQDMEDLVLQNIRKFTEKLGESDEIAKSSTKDGIYSGLEWSIPKNMTDWCGYLSFDIMGDICFSGSFKMLESKENRYILKLLPEGVNGLNMSGWMPGLLRLKLGKILFAKLNEDMQRYEAFSNEQSRRRLALNDTVNSKDVYSHLLASNKANGAGKQLFTPTDLVGESSLLITGGQCPIGHAISRLTPVGSDTTATALSSTIFYLLHNPIALARLETEILPRFQDVENIRGGALLSTCRWLRACIDEAMRISPGVPGLLPREVLTGGLVVENTSFPAGTDVGVPHYAIHHNEDYYPDSFAYKPERWIVDDGTTLTDVERAQSAFCPFSVGPRGCVGKGLAMKELMITIARVVWLYEMRLAPGDHRGEGGQDSRLGRQRAGEFQMRDMFVSKTDGPIVQYRLRTGRT
ncbi:MAG: hypothetical protein Q9160_006194 [Pyrenula sp. 1 TL-2023]